MNKPFVHTGVVCDHPWCRAEQVTPPLGNLCDPCTQRLQGQVWDLGYLHQDLTGILPAATTGARFDTAVSGSRTPPAPVRLDVADLRDQIHHLLVSWTQLVTEERGLDTWPRNEPLALAGWLVNQLGWLRRHTAVGDLAREVIRAGGRARALLAGTRPNVILPCPDTEATGCEGRIRIHAEATSATCLECGWSTFDLPWLGTLLRAGEPALVTAVDACHQLRVDGIVITPDTLRKWVQRGHVNRAGRDEAGRVLYELAEIRAHAHQSHRRRTRHPAAPPAPAASADRRR